MHKDPRLGLPSASAMWRVANCPGSQALINSLRQAGKVYELPSLEAASGSRIHEFLAHHDGELLNAQELALAQKCSELAGEIVQAWTGPGDLEPIIEKRLFYRQGLRPRFSGQPDACLIDHGQNRALILDHKTGRKEAQEAADNLQLRTLAVLLKAEYPELKEIDGAIIEPFVTWEPERVHYDSDSLREAESQILAFVDRAKWEPDNRVAGPWCAQCPARANCREAFQYADKIPTSDGQGRILELPRGTSGVVLWERIKVAKEILKSIEVEYKQIMQDDPAALPGYILPERGRERRYVPFPRKLKDVLADYLTEDEIDGCASWHLSKIEELFGLKHKIEGVELSRRFAAIVKGAVATTHDAPFIRPMTKRERQNENFACAKKPELTKS